MGGCQTYGCFLDPYSNTAPNIEGTQKGTMIILATTQIDIIRARFVGSGFQTKPYSIRQLHP